MVILYYFSFLYTINEINYEKVGQLGGLSLWESDRPGACSSIIRFNSAICAVQVIFYSGNIIYIYQISEELKIMYDASGE